MSDDSRITVTATNLFSIRTEPTSPKNAEAEADICANEQSKSTTYQSHCICNANKSLNLQIWMSNKITTL